MNKANANNNLKENKRILAQFNENTIRIYQAYNSRIADEALRIGTFGTHFNMDRMTWIKPSFLWMMYRSGWATKEGQERILAIDIKRAGFETILENAVISAFKSEIYENYDIWKAKLAYSEVRCQWDPDRDIHGNALNSRAIQLGLKGNMVVSYVNNWIVKINDITDKVILIKEAIQSNAFEEKMLPAESAYPLNENVKKIIGITF